MKQNKTYVVFVDLDKTLLTINSGKELVLTAYKNKYMSKIDFAKAVIISLLFKFNLTTELKITMLMAKWLKGISETKFEELANFVVETKLIKNFRQSVISEIEFHKKQGGKIVILSAALTYICKPLANHLELDDVICSGMEATNAVFTGKPIGQICIGKEKEVRARQYCLDNSFELQEAYCYGDSYSDRFILSEVGNPVCVEPDKELMELAKKMNWKIVRR